LEKYDALIGNDLAVFNAEFAKLNLNYLTIE